VVARTPGLRRRLGVAHLGIVAHFGGRRVHRIFRRIAGIIGGNFRLLQAHALLIV
jgi:hypothetical protein